MNLVIDNEFSSLIPDLSEDEYGQLEANVIAEGCRDALVVWQDSTILDGHNRYKICQEHNIDFETVEACGVVTRQNAIDWIINNQLGRRNLTREQMSYYRGKRYLREKQQGKRTDLTSGQNVQKLETDERLSQEYKVNPRTIRRDAQFAQAVDTLAEVGGTEVRKAILQREAPVTKKEIKKLARVAEKTPEKAKEIIGRIVEGQASSVRQATIQIQAEEIEKEPEPLPQGPFRVIVIDPPWEYYNRPLDTTHRAGNPYPSMSVEEIKGLPIANMVHNDCILWLWVTNAQLPVAFSVVEAWGFEYKTALTWVKDKMGLGDWLRGKTEHCLMCIKGKPIVNLTNQTTVIYGSMREYSRKPDEFYAMVEELCPGSKCELFSRTVRDGWITHGDQQEMFNNV